MKLFKTSSKIVVVNTILLLTFTFFLLASCSKEKDIISPPAPPPAPTAVANKPPVANAGKDTIITLPVDSIWLDGSASYDPEGKNTYIKWKQISGPEVWGVWIDNETAAETKVRLRVAGTYQFQLTVLDDEGAFARDTIQVIVHDFINPPALRGREVIFDNQVWVYMPGPVGGDYLYLDTPERPDLFINPYVKVEVFIKFDTSANWMLIESQRELKRNSFPDYEYSISKLITIFYLGNIDITGKKSSVKVKFL